MPIADGPGWRIRLAEATDRHAAEAFRGAYLEADVAVRRRRGGPAADSWLWHEIVGLPVVGRDGEELGTVVDIYRVAENDVYVVRGPRGEFDVPAVRDFVISIDPRAGGLVVDVDGARPAAGSAAEAVPGAAAAQGRRRPGRKRGRSERTAPEARQMHSPTAGPEAPPEPTA